jgi:hypothetical protein
VSRGAAPRAACLAAALLASPPALAEDPFTRTAAGTIRLEHADEVEYVERERRVELRGRVRLQYERHRIRADVIHVDLERETISAEGHLEWESDDLTARGSRMTFDTRSRTGVVEDVVLATGPWICRAARVEQPEEGTALIEPGLVTTCEASPPHYAIRARRLRIRPGRDLTAYSVTVVAGTTPVFWLPVLATPLREFRLPFAVQVGHTRELGGYVRTSPAYSFHPRLPGRLHVDYFERTGWGLGATQEWTDARGDRRGWAYGYRIRERTPARPFVPPVRWELHADSTEGLWDGARISVAADALSDAYVRAQYGQARLGLPVAAGERRAQVLLSQGFGAGSAGLLASRVDTLRLTDSATGESRYEPSEVHLPQLNATSRPWPALPWLSLSARGTADRFYTWRNGWVTDSLALAPSAEGHWQLPLLGQLTVGPRVTALWRDRGDRIVEDPAVPFSAGVKSLGGGYGEDENRGLIWIVEAGSSLRRNLTPGLEAELTHAVGKRLNRIGYDPYGYHGLLAHRVGGSVRQRLGRWGHAQANGGYDVRNRQDPAGRRWDPLLLRLEATPVPLVTASAEGAYDLWHAHRAFRTVTGSLTVGRPDPEGAYARLLPRYTNNALSPTEATRTSQDYRIARILYGPSDRGPGRGVPRAVRRAGAWPDPVGRPPAAAALVLRVPDPQPALLGAGRDGPAARLRRSSCHLQPRAVGVPDGTDSPAGAVGRMNLA